MVKEFSKPYQGIGINGIRCYLVGDKTFLITSKSWLKVLSSAAYGGERRWAKHIINHTVRTDYNCAQPDLDLARLAAKIGLDGGVVGLMTAVDVRQTVVQQGTKNELIVAATCTAGTGNACAAGSPIVSNKHVSTPGTINIVVPGVDKIGRAHV